MSHPQQADHVFYFISWLANTDRFDSQQVEQIIEDKFHAPLETLLPKANPLTEYYAKEMGTPLLRGISFICQPRTREEFVSLKSWSYQVESEFSQQGKRQLNLDLGYLALEHIVIATFKKYSHRIYVNDGVYAELCLEFKNGSYQALPWTYPDYQDPEKLQYFIMQRNILKKSLVV